MIALLRVYKKLGQKDGNMHEVAGAQPYAIYNERGLRVLEENDLLSIFPNSGKIFVPESHLVPIKQVFRFHELMESNSFDDTKYSSSKYFIGKEVNIDLFEVIELDETIENDKYQIQELLNKGLSIPFDISNSVILRTADDYLLGPIQLENINGIYQCEKLDFIPYYQQYIDTYKTHEHLFCIDHLLTENLVGWIDVTYEQRVISSDLKQHKDHTVLTELTRKMTSRLKDLYTSNTIIESHLQERIQRAIYFMESHTLTEENIALFTKLVLDIEITQSVIQHHTKDLFEKEYNGFIKENEKLVKENAFHKQELERLKKSSLIEKKTLETTRTQLTQIQETILDKINQLQDDFASVSTEKVTQLNLPASQQMSEMSVSDVAQRGFMQLQSTQGKPLSNINDFSKLLKNNLSIFKGHDEEGTLAATILTAVILSEPIIIYGDTSFELSKCIANTIACELTLTIIPEIETFTLNELHHQFKQFSLTEAVKAIIILIHILRQHYIVYQLTSNKINGLMRKYQ